MSKQFIPSFSEAIIGLTSFFGDTVQTVMGDTMSTAESRATLNTDDMSTFDLKTQSWAGDGGLRYQVPLVDLPSAVHTRTKARNIRILLDNVRSICVNDELPSTAEEKQFWSSYRFLKYQLFLKPYFVLIAPVYLSLRSAAHRIPRNFRGKTFPLIVTGVLAEQWMDATYPSHDLLMRALRAKTPLGDAARAEWQRLAPVTIPAWTFATYNFNLLVDPSKDFQFGGNISSALSQA